MNARHWIDTVHSTVTRAISRRCLLHAIATGLPLSLSITPAEAKKRKNRKKRGGKKKGQGSKPGRGAGACSGGACSDTWPSKSREDTRNRNYCEFICEQCDGPDPREFCIIDGDVEDPSLVAVCCPEGRKCCGTTCCAEGAFCCGTSCCAHDATCCSGRMCCNTANPNFKCCGDRCFNTAINPDNCGRCGNSCASNEVCQQGVCVCGPGASNSSRTDSESCAPACPPGESRCGDGCCPDNFRWACCADGTCRWIGGGDENNCGACDAVCPRGQFCENGGFCTCGDGNKYCDEDNICINQHNICCGNVVNCPAELNCCFGVDGFKYCSAAPCL